MIYTSGFFKRALKKAIFSNIISKKQKNTHKQETIVKCEPKEAVANIEPPKQQEQPQENLAFHEQEYRKALRLYDEAQADKAYQKKLTQYFEILTQIKETYSVINNVGSFCDDAGEKLIEKCTLAISIEADIKEKREYYDDHVFDMSPPCKTLAMIFEKRGEYQRAATICVYAIENGYTNDGTAGGMRGRLGRMIKKGNLPLTDNLKNILNI